MIREYESNFYNEPIIVENIDDEVCVSILDNLERESVYGWYDLKNKNTPLNYINKWILWGLMQESINKVLILWSGWGTYIKYIEDNFIYAEITAVDVDPTMIEIAKKELNIETKNIFTDDVLRFTKKLIKKWEKFDLILFDIYGSTGEIPKHIIVDDLFTDLWKLLYPSGIFSINYANFYLKSHDIIDQERKKKYILIHRKLVDTFWEHFISFLENKIDGENISVSYNLNKEYSKQDILEEYNKKIEFEDINPDENLIKNLILDEKKIFLR